MTESSKSQPRNSWPGETAQGLVILAHWWWDAKKTISKVIYTLSDSISIRPLHTSSAAVSATLFSGQWPRDKMEVSSCPRTSLWKLDDHHMNLEHLYWERILICIQWWGLNSGLHACTTRCSTTWVTAPVHFALETGSWELFARAGLQTILTISASQVTRITGMNYGHLAIPKSLDLRKEENWWFYFCRTEVWVLSLLGKLSSTWVTIPNPRRKLMMP
jgi:hypothetical protein